MKTTKCLIAALLCSTAMSASAGKLAGKNVILLQGFQLQHVFLSRTADDGKRFGYNYWNRFGLFNNGNGAVAVAPPLGFTLLDQNLPMLVDANGTKFNIYDTSKEAVFHTDQDPNARILHFDSSYRLEEPNGKGVGVTVARQLNELFRNDPTYCARTNGCIVITHSTGDLVMQYIEDHKATLLDANARTAFDVVAYVDLAGARGGTEGATILFELANFLNRFTAGTVLSASKQNEINIANYWLNLLFGSSGVDYLAPGKHFQSGILYDLQPRMARNTGLNNPDNVPHLRLASAGDEPYGFITHLFIKGHDDSVVPLHSACGSDRDESYNSCVPNRTLSGKATLLADAPVHLYRHHYPFLQSAELRHNGHQWNDTGNTMVPLMATGQVVDGLNVDIETDTFSEGFLNHYTLIKDAEQKTIAQVLTESLN